MYCHKCGAGPIPDEGRFCYLCGVELTVASRGGKASQMSRAPRLFDLSCPACAGKLSVSSDTRRFACAHCGREMVVIGF